ncbi:MAG: hypothetical protein ALECFALPRED_010904 [Alectoria fallacina]|uniref:Uncharacterized protein n=1 Tax=Alectoria fallacina TaxID=1903189 RepID=A0A8H3J9T0_9LECA|nr:MAG: hypothetical protein ALECFALPRED_010904 [Alectoria fallacina]
MIPTPQSSNRPYISLATPHSQRPAPIPTPAVPATATIYCLTDGLDSFGGMLGRGSCMGENWVSNGDTKTERQASPKRSHQNWLARDGAKTMQMPTLLPSFRQTSLSFRDDNNNNNKNNNKNGFVYIFYLRTFHPNVTSHTDRILLPQRERESPWCCWCRILRLGCWRFLLLCLFLSPWSI